MQATEAAHTACCLPSTSIGSLRLKAPRRKRWRALSGRRPKRRSGSPRLAETCSCWRVSETGTLPVRRAAGRRGSLPACSSATNVGPPWLETLDAQVEEGLEVSVDRPYAPSRHSAARRERPSPRSRPYPRQAHRRNGHVELHVETRPRLRSPSSCLTRSSDSAGATSRARAQALNRSRHHRRDRSGSRQLGLQANVAGGADVWLELPGPLPDDYASLDTAQMLMPLSVA